MDFVMNKAKMHDVFNSYHKFECREVESVKIKINEMDAAGFAQKKMMWKLT